MAWTVDEIENDFLSGKLSAFTIAPVLAVESFERVESVLGRDWIFSRKTGKGLMVVSPILDMGLRLSALDGIPNCERLVNSIRQGGQHAEAELTAIHMIRTHHPLAQFELYPPVDGRVADFRVRSSEEQWTTVEVTQPDDSQEKIRLQKIVKKIIDALADIESQCVLEVILSREPTEEEIAALCDRLPEFCRLQGRQQARLINDMGFLLLNQTEVNTLVEHVIPGCEIKPMTGIAMFAGGGPNGGPHHQIQIRIPFTDDRANNILADEAKQLPKEGRGLVMIDVSRAGGSFESWEPLFRRRFQPTLHTRVSGVCLFEGATAPTDQQYEWLCRTKLVTNPYAKVQLPEWIQNAIEQAGEEFAQKGLR